MSIGDGSISEGLNTRYSGFYRTKYYKIKTVEEQVGRRQEGDLLVA